MNASEQGREMIRQARTQKGWRVDDAAPLQEASKWLLRQHQQNHHWPDDDHRWVRDLNQLLRGEDSEISDLQQALARGRSHRPRIEEFIDAGQALFRGISYGTWSRFLAGKSAVRAQVFKSYCQILDLDWAIIASENSIVLPDRAILHNLVASDFSTLVGRQRELEELMRLLRAESRVHRISLCGMGGVGKTALMLELAYRCLQENGEPSGIPTFDAIIFTSAKSSQLTVNGQCHRLRWECTLPDILRTIADTLNCREVLVADLQQQIEGLHRYLSRQRTLLLLDNLDTIADAELVRSFVGDLPLSVKVVMTSRRQEFSDRLLPLAPLSVADSLTLIQQHAQTKQVVLSPSMSQQILQATAGVPLAIAYAVGQLAAGYPVDYLLTRSSRSMEELTRYCFDQSVVPLRGQSSHRLLMAIALFPRPAQSAALAATAEVSRQELIEGLVQLQQQSLIQRQDDRYALLPLTRTYVEAELSVYPDFEQAARSRWLAWYVQFVQQHGNADWQEWREYDPLEYEWENLRMVVEHCIAHEHYEEFLQLWRQLKGYTHTYGYWNERLVWMDWLIQTAEERQDSSTLAEALFDKARTLGLLGQPTHLEAAIALNDRVWNLLEEAVIDDRTLRFAVLLDRVVSHLHLKQFDAAASWLSIGERLLAEPLGPPLESVGGDRCSVQLLYYRAQLCFHTQSYMEATRLYHQALSQAQAIEWQRGIIYIQDWLALVAIQQEEYGQAESLLMQGLTAAEHNRDRRCTAFCQRSLALLENARHNPNVCTRWATLAKETFTQLQMLQEAREMDELLRSK